MLEVTEIFHSLQGEGPFSGRPAVFLRLSGCLKPYCPWCDTMYALTTGTMMSLDAVCRRITGFAAGLVVITGGEPFLQWQTGVKRLEERLLEQGYLVQYETGGKVAIPTKVQGFVVCSPKFLDGCWVFDRTNLARAQAFKFVADNDFDDIGKFVRRLKIRPDRVFIMPRGTSREEQLDTFQNSWRFCVENGFRFSPRLHILTFNNQRGV